MVFLFLSHHRHVLNIVRAVVTTGKVFYCLQMRTVLEWKLLLTLIFVRFFSFAVYE